MTSRLVLVGTIAVLALLGASPAAAEPCWQRVISDWSDGRIDNVYSADCYRGSSVPAALDGADDSRPTSLVRDCTAARLGRVALLVGALRRRLRRRPQVARFIRATV